MCDVICGFYIIIFMVYCALKCLADSHRWDFFYLFINMSHAGFKSCRMCLICFLHTRPLNRALVSLGLFLPLFVATCNCCLCFLRCNLVAVSQAVG